MRDSFKVNDLVCYAVWAFSPREGYTPTFRRAEVHYVAGDLFHVRCHRCDGVGKVTKEVNGHERREKCWTCDGHGLRPYTVPADHVRVLTYDCFGEPRLMTLPTSRLVPKTLIEDYVLLGEGRNP